VNGEITLGELHRTIQEVMEWEGYHLHTFDTGGAGFREPELSGTTTDEDERRIRLRQVISSETQCFLYEYDFGDGREHDILVEKILPLDPEMRYPVCLKGKRACPPEDVGGPWGYADFLEAIQDPDHPEHEDYLEWFGEDFDPEYFDLEAINRALEKYSPER